MAKEGRDLVKEAVKDAKSLKDAALEAARNEIIEGMAPRLRSMLDEAVKGALGRESVDRTNAQGSDYYSPASREKQRKWEEGKVKGDSPMDDNKKEKELDMESLAGFFPQMGLGLGEEPDPEADPDVDPDEATSYESALSAAIPQLGEEPDPEEDPDCDAPEAKMKEEFGDPANEEIEISESELRKVYEAALQTEVQVKKGFGEMTKAGELEDVAKDVGKGLNPAKSGETSWEKVEPPAKEDYTVKEAIFRGLQENKMLRENLRKAVQLVKMLGGKLHEVNLFNAKVLHVNRILNAGGRLTKEQKAVVMESIDKARSISEVKMVYEAIVSSFKAAMSLTEGKNQPARKPVANAQRARTSGTPKQEVLSESVDRANGGGKYDRLRELAGLTK